MNETIKTLLNRRSVRAYNKEQIKDEELELILDTGKFAPNGMNSQPWLFTVIQNKDLLNKINSFIREGLLKNDTPNQAMKERAKAEDFSIYYNAPTLIIVSGNTQAVTPMYDCALAMGNMFNGAASLGIGSCWIHAVGVALNNEIGKDLKNEIGIPEGHSIFTSGAFGYNAGEAPLPAPRVEGTVNFIK